MKQKLKNSLHPEKLTRSFYYLLLRELKRYFRDPELTALTVVLPLFLAVLFIWIYGSGAIRELPVAVFDEDNSEISRTMVQAVRSSSAMEIILHVNSVKEIESAFKSGKIQGAFYFPHHMERDIKKSRQVHPVVFKNAQNIICSSFLTRESVNIFKTFNGGILLKKLTSKGLSKNQVMGIIKPISVDGTVLYNSNFNYQNFLSPGIILAQMQLLFMISGVLLITREYDKKSLRSLYFLSNNRIWTILPAKLIPLHILSGAVMAIMLGVLFKYAGIIVWNKPSTWLLTMLYISVSAIFGMGIGALLRDTLIATEVSIFLGIPAFILSGYTFPLWAVPDFLSTFSQILPFTHFFTLYFKVAQMHLPIRSGVPEITALLCLTIIPLTIIHIRSIVDSRKISSLSNRVGIC